MSNQALVHDLREYVQAFDDEIPLRLISLIQHAADRLEALERPAETEVMRRSYPYLALSRRLGVPYGIVLHTADLVDEGAQVGASYWQADLTREQNVAVREVWAEEERRRVREVPGYRGPHPE